MRNFLTRVTGRGAERVVSLFPMRSCRWYSCENNIWPCPNSIQFLDAPALDDTWGMWQRDAQILIIFFWWRFVLFGYLHAWVDGVWHFFVHFFLLFAIFRPLLACICCPIYYTILFLISVVCDWGSINVTSFKEQLSLSLANATPPFFACLTKVKLKCMARW